LPFYEEISWELAECRDIDTEMFYRPEEVRLADPVLYLDPVRAICAACPIWADCLAYATVHEFFGIWGGMTSLERKAVQDSFRSTLRLKVLNDMRKLGISESMIYEALEVIKK